MPKSDGGAQRLSSVESGQGALVGHTGPSAGSSGITEQEMIAWMKDGIDWLSKEATIQEQSLQELSLAAENKFLVDGNPIHLAGEGMGYLRVWAEGFPIHRKAHLADRLDIGAAANAPVQAPAQGRVTTVGFDP